MRKMWRKIAAAALSIAMLLTVSELPVCAVEIVEASTEAYTEGETESTAEVVEASTEVSAEDETESAAKITEAEVWKEETEVEPRQEEVIYDAGVYILNYIYIDYSEIYQYEEQSVCVDIENIDTDRDKIEDIRLGYSVDNQDYEISYTRWQDTLVVFDQTVTRIGTYEIHYIDIRRDSDTIRLDFSDEAIAITDAEFNVIENCESYDDYSVDSDIESDILTEETILSDSGIQFDVEQMEPVGADGNVVVVLDPGHDSVHTGASGNGLHEEVLTLKIAQYCKAELEKYDNVTVYMTRSDGSCLNTSSNGACLKARCNYAASVGANLLVSIHIDAGSLTGTGAMVIVAKMGIYRDDLAQVTQDAGSAILEELTELGLASRGLYVRMSDSSGSEYVYANGAVADYYSITRNSIKAGISGIIVEHCFISNASDVANYLSSESKLQALGVADATGIANYFGLKKSNGESSVGEALYDTSTELYESTGENISDFVALLYQRALGRTPSKAEVSYWVRRIEVEKLTGSAIVKRFLNSDEFKLHSYSEEEYVEKLYEIFLGRSSDPSGKEHWMTLLRQGYTRLQIAERIGNSEEFELVCARYGMAQGSHSMQYAKLYPEVADFVSYYYIGLLNRQPDQSGLEHWCQFLIQGGNSAELTRRFINSPEFTSRNLEKSDFVEGLYWTYLRRASDASGKEHWMSMLSTMSYSEKLTVIRGFLRSEEYHNYCSQYGITVGTL